MSEQVPDEELHLQETFFSGQLRTNASSYLLAPEDFTALQNYRYTPMGIKGRYGMTAYGSDSGYIIPHVKKDGSTVIHYQAAACTFAQVEGEIFKGEATNIKIYNYSTPAWKDLGDDWSGDWLYPNGAVVDAGAGIVDYTGFVYLDNTSTYLEAGALTTSDEIYLGFMDVPSEIWLDLVPGAVNTTTHADPLALEFWDSTGNYVPVTGALADGTSTGTGAAAITLAQSGQLTGFITLNALASIQHGIPHELYWFKLTVPATLSADVNIWQVRAKPKSSPPSGYKSVVAWKGRLWLYGDPDNPNIFRYSKRNYPETWNGDDSSIVEAGENQPISFAISYHNEMLVFKTTGEVGLMEGYSPATFAYEIISSCSGAVAPQSIVKVETGVMVGGANKKTVAIYLSSDGVRMCDGLTTPLISQDISAYFDKNDSRYIAAADMDDAVAWMDYTNNEYHLSVPNSKEFVYNVEFGKWSTFDRSTMGGGIVWTGQTIENNHWESVCWSPKLELYAAVSSSGTNKVATSPDGKTWTHYLIAGGSGWYSVCWSPDLEKFVAVGTWDSLTSSDGINWASHTMSSGEIFRSVCWSSGLNLFVAVGHDYTRTSVDGEVWSARLQTLGNWTSVCWSPALNLLVAVGDGTTHTNRVITSEDGLAWIVRSAVLSEWGSVCWSPDLNLFVAVATADTNRVMISSNGINWDPYAVTANNWFSVCWSPELKLFVAVAYTGTNRIMTSPNGQAWSYSLVDTETWRGICWSPELLTFVVVGYSEAMTGEAGLDFTNAVTFFNNNEWLTLAGTASKIYKLEDGETDDSAAITYIAETKDHWQNEIINYRKFMLQSSHFASGTITLSHALDGIESYTSDGTMDVSKTGYRFCMPVEDLNLNGSSVRWKIETTKRLEMYKYLTYSKPVRDLKDHPGN